MGLGCIYDVLNRMILESDCSRVKFDEMRIAKKQMDRLPDTCSMDKELGEKGRRGILESMESGAVFLYGSNHRIRFVYTPKHSSWMNQIEIWFGISHGKLLKRKSYNSYRRASVLTRSFID